MKPMTEVRKTAIRRVPPAEAPASWHHAEAALEHWSGRDWTNGLQIESLDDLDSVSVHTANSVYEITILSRATAEVLVRGGRFFPERTVAFLSGSSLGGCFLKMRGIYLDFNLEFQHGGRRVVTSRVRSIGVVV